MSNMEHTTAGDQVVIVGRFSNSLSTVERVTKTQIVTRDGKRWRRRDGSTVGRGPFDVGYIRDATDDDRDHTAALDNRREA